MYSTMTWRTFDSLVRNYCKADANSPKPKTFRQLCNTRLLQLMGVLAGLDDPRYARAHVLRDVLSLPYFNSEHIEAIVDNVITWGFEPWVPGTMVFVNAKTDDGWVSGVFRVLTRIDPMGNDYTVEVLFGTPVINNVGETIIYPPSSALSVYDTSALRFRSMKLIEDFPVASGVTQADRVYYPYTRSESFQTLSRDASMDPEVAWYNQGGVLQFRIGVDALPIFTPQIEFDCMPSVYTEVTPDNNIELLPEHLRMLFDGVAANVLTILNKEQPVDLKARLNDDMLHYYNAKAEEVARDKDRLTRTNV